MIKNIFYLLCMTIGLASMQSCIKKKEPVAPAVQRQAGNKAGAATKPRPGQAARQKAAAAKRNNAKNVKGNTAGKPVGYWPALRQHLGIDGPQLFKLKANYTKRTAELAKPGANANTINTKFDAEAKKLLGPAMFAKMQSFTMK